MYKSGIMVQKSREPEKDNSANYAQVEGAPHAIAQTESSHKTTMAHQPLDHSIYIVGWGFDKEKDMPYWIIRNSYGDSWGQNGDFLVRRGQDDYGVESEITAFDVELAKDEEKEAAKEKAEERKRPWIYWNPVKVQ